MLPPNTPARREIARDWRPNSLWVETCGSGAHARRRLRGHKLGAARSRRSGVHAWSGGGGGVQNRCRSTRPSRASRTRLLGSLATPGPAGAVPASGRAPAYERTSAAVWHSLPTCRLPVSLLPRSHAQDKYNAWLAHFLGAVSADLYFHTGGQGARPARY
ncbi:hypothetical protein AURDEDRAFT_176772 [Auricularia subglabra TFB-10046 SS5]|uniref:Uncharacterized protein n=1 Tax=Auricularia subglabra (strain TFB-10046 / SS5) TaxID=717982 RepID=J0WP43_AURST|nr:hypothetical protein AURDEDRAFT_176772 [Auricularia subglabra TFB-10046 SS5]